MIRIETSSKAESWTNEAKKSTRFSEIGRQAMTDHREDNYLENENDSNEGHMDTRHHNFECDRPDEHLGCDLGIDVAG
jgi:hypothetical protein